MSQPREMIAADLLMVPRGNEEPSFVSGVLVQLIEDKPFVSVFIKNYGEAGKLSAIGDAIVRALNAT